MAQPLALGNTNTGSLVDCAGTPPRDCRPHPSSQRSRPLLQAAGGWRVAGHQPAPVKEFSDCPQALPISRPAAKTSAPPSTTWKIARLHGVSIQWF
jgi:hypothetical protein